MTEPIQSGDRPPQPPRRRSPAAAIVVLLVALAAGLIVWWRWPAPVPPVTPAQAPAEAPAGEPPGQDGEAAASGETAGPPTHPVGAAEPLPAPADAARQLEDALAGLVGRPALALLRADDLARRVVATVDNLPRAHAPAQAWPVTPAAGRFSVEAQNGGTAVADGNSARYTAYVALAESVDPARLAALYARFYPLFQRAYEELGYPGRHFNDRLVEVIDHLLQAPEPQPPLRVALVEVRTGDQGERPPARPWVRYEFADPKLEALSAGQKLMIRVGLDNERRLKARLAAFRRQVADGALAGRTR